MVALRIIAAYSMPGKLELLWIQVGEEYKWPVAVCQVQNGKMLGE